MSQKGVPAPPQPHIHTGEKKVVFAYDLVCPYAYVASMLIEELAHEYGAKVEYLPGHSPLSLHLHITHCQTSPSSHTLSHILHSSLCPSVLLSGLVALDKASRESDEELPPLPAAKKVYQKTSLLREAARHNVELHFPANHPVRTASAMRVLAAVNGSERVQLTHALYRSYWVEGKDISSESVIAQCISQCNINPARINSQPPHRLHPAIPTTTSTPLITLTSHSHPPLHFSSTRRRARQGEVD